MSAVVVSWRPARSEDEAELQEMLEARLARDGRSVALLVRIARAGGKVTRTVFKVCGRSAAFGWVCVSKHRSEARANAAAAKLRRAPVGRQYHEVTVVEERCS